jgi:hypothetical protein
VGRLIEGAKAPHIFNVHEPPPLGGFEEKADMGKVDLGLYDSANGKSLDASKVVDLSARFGESMRFAYAMAERGPLVQFRWGSDDCARIHYFYDEPSGERMIREDAHRWNMSPDALMRLVHEHAI